MRRVLYLVLCGLGLFMLWGMGPPGYPGTCEYGNYFPPGTVIPDAGVVFKDAGPGEHPGFNCPLLAMSYKWYVVDLTTAPPSMTLLSPTLNTGYNGALTLFNGKPSMFESTYKVWVDEYNRATGFTMSVLRPFLAAHFSWSRAGRFQSVTVVHNLAAPKTSVPVFTIGPPATAQVSELRPVGDGSYYYRMNDKEGNVATFFFQGCN